MSDNANAPRPMWQHPLYDAHQLALQFATRDPRALQRHEVAMYSQNGEDGIIAEIFRRVGPGERIFVELGVDDGQENNTRFLLEQGWRGFWFDGNQAALEQARETFADFIDSGALTITHALIDRGNAQRILDAAGVPARVDFFSIDLDQATSHLWRAIKTRARVACVEYNGTVPAGLALEVPMKGGLFWDGTAWYGGSLKTMELIGRERGLNLVGCDSHGINAFFVEAGVNEALFAEPFTAENHWIPLRMALHSLSRAKTARQWVVPPEAGGDYI